MPKTKKGHFRDIFGEKNPFFRPESSVFEIALVILVGVCTHEKILRPTQNPTLAGMESLYMLCTVSIWQVIKADRLCEVF